MRMILIEFKRSLIATTILVVILCAIYPLLVWSIAQIFFPYQSNGSFITKNNTIIGSELIAQRFSGPGYFHSRPSSAGNGYDALSSGGSNLGPISKDLIARIQDNIKAYRMENGLSPDTKIPADAVATSASGLDPHISIENIMLQANRVAKSRGLDKQVLIGLIQSATEGRQLDVFGEPGINVILLNMKLDERK